MIVIAIYLTVSYLYLIRFVRRWKAIEGFDSVNNF